MRFNQDVGSPTNERFLLVTSTPQKVTILAPLYNTLELHNDDATNTVYFGDQNVTAGDAPIGTGMPLLAGDFRFFKGAYNAFSVWLVCLAGTQVYVKIMEYP